MAFAESQIAYPRIVDLNQHLLDRIQEIETLSYPNPWSRNLLESELNNSTAIVVGLLVDEHLVAQSFNHLILDELHILNIAVHPEYRGAGLAKALLAEVILRSIRKGASVVTLEVRTSNEIARKLYLDFSFQIVGIRKNYYSDNAEDALILSRKVSDEDIRFFSDLRGHLID